MEEHDVVYLRGHKNIAALFGKAWDIPIDFKPQKELQEKYMASFNGIRAGVFPPGRELTLDGGRKALEEL